MTTALEVVKEVYNRFAQGDLDGFLALCADDIEWVVNGPANLKKSNAYKGRTGVQQFLDILADWEFSSFLPQEFIVDGQTVVVLGEETGKDLNTDVPFENRWAHVFDVNEGRVTRFREFLCHWTGEQTPPAMSWNAA